MNEHRNQGSFTAVKGVLLKSNDSPYSQKKSATPPKALSWVDHNAPRVTPEELHLNVPQGSVPSNLYQQVPQVTVSMGRATMWR
jgi:hypothetical protein